MVLGYNYNESGQYGMQQINSPTPSPNMNNFCGAKCEFSYEALAAATCGFSDANLLGQGGFGLVHKGVLPNGQEVAVKSLKSGSGQGEREFQAEVEIISRVHHRHLVSLVGYCIASGQRMLVYEFVPNGTLEYHLHRKYFLFFQNTTYFSYFEDPTFNFCWIQHFLQKKKVRFCL